MIQGTPAATGASGVTGVQQVPLNSAGQPCPRSAGAPAPAGGQKSASVSTLKLTTFEMVKLWSQIIHTNCGSILA